MLSKLRALWRLSRRDMRTHWVRSVVMVAMVAVPVAIMNAASFGDAAANSDWTRSYHELREGSVATARVVSVGPVHQTGDGKYTFPEGTEFLTGKADPQNTQPENLKKHLRASSEAIRELAGGDDIQVGTELQLRFQSAPDAVMAVTASARFEDYGNRPAADKDTGGHVAGQPPMRVVAGKLPVEKGQVLLPQHLAGQLGVGVGDKISASFVYYRQIREVLRTVPSTPAELTVSGLSETSGENQATVLVNSASFPALHRAQTVWASGDGQAIDAAQGSDLELLTTVGENSKFYYWGDSGINFDQITQANKSGVVVYSRQVLTDRSQAALNNGYEEGNYGASDYEKGGLGAYGLAFFIYSILFGFAVLATALLIPVSSLFSQSLLPTGRIVMAVGATRRQWRSVIVLTQLALIMLGLVLGTAASVIIAIVGLKYREGLPFTQIPFSWGIVVAEAIAALLMATASGIIGNRQVEKVLSREGMVPAAPSRKVFFTGLVMGILGPVLVVASMAARQIILWAFAPMYVVITLVGFSMMVPMLLHWIDRYISYRLRKKQNRKAAEPDNAGRASDKPAEASTANKDRKPGGASNFVMGARLAFRDLLRRRHRTVPALAALVILVGGATVMTPMLGLVNVYSSGNGNSKAVGVGGVLVKPTIVRADATLRDREMDRMGQLVSKYLSVGKGVEVKGIVPSAVTQANLKQLADPNKWGGEQQEIVKQLAKDASEFESSKDEYWFGAVIEKPEAGATGTGSPAVLTVGARNPQGTYSGCPKVDPHVENFSGAIPYDFDIRAVADPKEREHCQWLLKRIADSGLPLNIDDATIIVDDGTFLKGSGQSADPNIDAAIKVLQAGGVLVGDPALIADGKTTVVLALDRSPHLNAIPDPAIGPDRQAKNPGGGDTQKTGNAGEGSVGTEAEASKEIKAVTVPAMYWPVPVGKLDSVIASTQVAGELGLKPYPVARLYLPDGGGQWIRGLSLLDAFDAEYGREYIQINQPSADVISGYLVMVGLITFATMFISLMLVILTGLELRRPLRVLRDVGATPGLQRWFGAWFSALIVIIGMVAGMAVGSIVLDLFQAANIIANGIEGTASQPLFGLYSTSLGKLAIASNLLWTPWLAGILGAWLIPRGITGMTSKQAQAMNK